MAIITGADVGIYAERDPLTGTPLVNGGSWIPILIGTSSGKNVRVDSPEAIIHSTIGGTGTVTYGPLGSVISISDSTTGAGTLYRNGTDYTPVDTSVGGSTVIGIDWSANTTLAAPVLSTPTATTGGSLVADTYYYKVTAIRRRRLSPTVYGETTPSSEQSVITTSTNNAVTLSWTPVIGAEGYRIYRSSTAGFFTNTRLTTLSGGGYITYTDTGSATGAGSPPAANDAYRQPAVGATYYVDYYYNSITYNTKVLYTGLEELQTDHGVTSQLGIAGRLVMGTGGRGAAAGQCYVIPIASHSEANHNLAIEEAEKIEDLLLMVPLTTNMGILNNYFAHVNEMSNIWNKKERMLFCGAANGTTYGDTTTAGTIIYNAQIFASDPDYGRRVVYCAPDGAYLNVENTTTNVVTETLYGGEMLAASLAGLCSALPDSAEPATYDRVFGFTRLYDGTYNINDNVINKKLNSYGVTIFKNINGVIRIYHSITTAGDTIENSELNIQLADDYLAKLLRDTMESAGILGTKVTPQTIKRIEDITRTVLNTCQNNQIIGSYDSLKAYADNTDSRIVYVVFQYSPIYPCNVIYFKRGFSL